MLVAAFLSLLACSSAGPLFNNQRGRAEFDWMQKFDWSQLKTTDGVTQIAAVSQAMSATYSFISPKNSLSAFGDFSNPDASEVAFARSVASLQLASAFIISSGYFISSEDAKLSSSVAMASTAVALMMSLPGLETLDVDKEMVGRWVVLLGALGRLSLEPQLSAFNPAMVIFTLVGGNFLIKPKFTAEMYNVKGTSKTSQELLKMSGGNLLAVAGYLVTLKEQSHAYGLSVYLGLQALSALKYAFFVTKTKDKEEGIFTVKKSKAWTQVRRWLPAAWAVLQGGLATMAFLSGEEDKGRSRRKVVD